MCYLFMRNLLIDHEKGNSFCDKFHILYIIVSSSVLWTHKIGVQGFLAGV